MRRWFAWWLVSVAVAGCQTAPPSPSIEYKVASASLNARALVAMNQCLSQPDGSELLGDHLRCGPFLWREIQTSPAVASLGNAVKFELPVQGSNGVEQATILEGRDFVTKEEVRAFWKAFAQTIPPQSLQRFRTLSQQECRIYWVLTRSVIQEPVFIAEGEKAKILMQAMKTGDTLTLSFIDDFRDVTIRD